MRFRTKSIIAFLGAGLFCVGVTGIALTYQSEQSLREAAYQHLLSVREAKGHALRAYFDEVRRELSVLADCPMVAEGMAMLPDALDKLPQEYGKPIRREDLAPAIAKPFRELCKPIGIPGELPPEAMVAQNDPGLVLQTLYIAAKPQAQARLECADAGDGSTYSRLHSQFHPLFLSYYRKFRFEDFFLIDLDGHVVYTVIKGLALGTKLKTGPLRETSLARAFKASVDDQPGEVWIEPFAFYPPAGMEPAAFISCPIFREGKRLGVLAARISADAIDEIASGGRQWQNEGLGESGEVYLVGPDGTLRSNPRGLIENLPQYIADMRRGGVDEQTLGLISRLKSAILLQKINTTFAHKALAGESAMETSTCYHGKPTIAAYAPFDASPKLRWGIVAKIHAEEAFAAIDRMRQRLRWMGAVAVVSLTVLAWILSGFVVGPLRRLTEHASTLGKGNLDARIDIRVRDELGDLAGAFNDMAQKLKLTTVSKDYVAGILESMTDCLVVIDSNFGPQGPTIQVANKAACVLLQRDASELVGRKALDVVARDIRAEDADGQEAAPWLEQIRQGRKVQGVEVDWLLPQGQVVPMLFSAAVLVDMQGKPQAIVCVGHDLRPLKQAQKIQREHDRMQRELDIAHHVQQDLLPKEPLSIPGYELAGFSKAATEAGGDYYDWLMLPDGRAVMTIADATGHGIGPALMVTVCRAYFRAATQVDDAIEQAVARVNDLMASDLPEGSFVTAAIAALDPRTGTLQVYSAGHGPTLFYQARQKKVLDWKADTVPLGLLKPMMAGPSRDLPMEPGDVLLMLTDGFFEWSNPDGEQYGTDRLGRFVEQNAGLDPAALIDKLRENVLEFARGTPQLDDLTAVAIRRRD